MASTPRSFASRGRALRSLLGLMSVFVPAASASAASLGCDSPAPLEVALPQSGRLPVAFTTEHSAWLWIEERGHDLQIDGADGLPLLSVQTPPRHGLSLLRVDASDAIEIARQLSGTSPARVMLSLDCGAIDPDLQRWLEEAATVAQHLGGGIGSLSGQSPPAALSALPARAPAPRWRALGLHLQAQWLLLEGRSIDAAPAFIEAARAWDRVGAAAQAAAARVAAAENLRLAGRGSEALALSRAAAGAPDRRHYFGVRLEAARCGALFERGDLPDASACYAWVQAAYAALEEPLEGANAAVNHADLLRRLGQPDEARSRVLAALEALQGPQSAAARGRAELSLAETAAHQGDVSEVLQRLQAAQGQFERAKEVRWRAHVLRRLASTLLELGAAADAQIALQAAQALLDPQHAPAPYASGQLLQARLLRDRAPYSERIALIQAAQSVADRIDQRELFNAAALERAELEWEFGHRARALEALLTLRDPSPREQARAAHLRRLIEPGTLSTPHVLAAMHPPAAKARAPRGFVALNLSERVAWQREAARRRAIEGAPQQAQAELLAAARALDALRLQTGNALLDQALAAQILRLRATAVELQARSMRAQAQRDPSDERWLLDWLGLGLPAGADEASSEFAQLDAELGRLLLGEGSGARAETLLAALASRSARIERQPASADALRASFNARSPLQILLNGEQQGLQVEWSPQQLGLRVIEDLPDLREALLRLSRALHNPGTPVQQLHQASADVAARLQLPSSLLARGSVDVLADDLGLEIEWAVLPGPEGQPLGETHRLRLLQLSPNAGRPLALGTLQLLQAAQRQNPSTAAGARGGPALPALRAAEAEAQQILSALPDREIRRQALSEREQLLSALLRDDTWLHVSAHGQLQPDLLAGSGLWMDPAAPAGAPQFVSALDVQMRGARAPHVVLNACQLAQNADGPADLTGQASFAQALVRAGAGHVIAARWPVSDSASQLWVPAYYGALQLQAEAGTPLDPAAALRAARQSLQRSRAFRHPYHWAAWVHFEALPWLPQAAEAAEAPQP